MSTAEVAMKTLKVSAATRPWRRARTPNVVRLVAGPVSRNASAAPGETPEMSSTATNGVAPLAQT